MAFKSGKDNLPKFPKRIDETLNLNQEELEILLQLIKVSNFSGDMVEKVYNVTYKLQMLHNKLNK